MDKRFSYVGSLLEPPTKLFVFDIMVKFFSKKEKLSRSTKQMTLNLRLSQYYIGLEILCILSAAAAFTF